MCGICGFYKVDKYAREIDRRYIEDMNFQMILRGPDGGGVWMHKENRCGFGHRRLSIIDISENASQPMQNEDGSIIVVFNGEIYNHAEIRKELSEIGMHHWISDHSDTEVIVHAYEQWGISCIKKFRGMFAIALWDDRKEELYLVRDRLGIKPLYYTVENGILTFASEIKAILKVRDKKATINEKTLYDYLSFLSTPCEETLFDNINKLRPATYMCMNKNGYMHIRRYWDVWDHTHPELFHANDADISEALLSELRDAVRYRKTADVPVGVFLSGGVDSSTNAALIMEESREKVKAFCIGYKNNDANYENETTYARKMAKYCGAEYYEKLLTQEDLLSFINDMVFLQDEPIADPTCVPAYYVAKLARENGIRVAQVGEGADELFCGYPAWLGHLKRSKIDSSIHSKIIKKAAFNIAAKYQIFDSRIVEYIRRASLAQPVFWSGSDLFPESDKKKMISENLRKKIGSYTSFEAIRPTYNRFQKKAWETSDLNWMSYADLNHRLPELLLMRVDKMSMGVSLECRVPFLDHKFVELAMSIPQEKKVDRGINKIVLKKAVKGIIPDEIIDRKKQGFGFPIVDWYTGKMGNEMKRKIRKLVRETTFFDRSYLMDILNKNDYVTAARAWTLYNLALWWEQYIA